MKLLLDENLSHRLVPALQADYPGSTQVTLEGLGGTDDLSVWRHARESGWVIRLVLGNCSNAQVLAILHVNRQAIVDTVERNDIGVIELG